MCSLGSRFSSSTNFAMVNFIVRDEATTIVTVLANRGDWIDNFGDLHVYRKICYGTPNIGSLFADRDGDGLPRKSEHTNDDGLPS